MGWAETSDTTSTTTTGGWYTYSNGNTYTAHVSIPVLETFTRWFSKGKFFKFESSMEFRAWFKRPDTVPREVKSRHGFQQMCRLPCYRGVRTR